MKSIVSIIVPVYKVEKYIDRCIESLINQTLVDIEIILVDDGSPDRSPQICDQWAKLDNRIIVLHKQNGGLSSARNAGLEIASGKYVGFVDSDDDVELDMYEKMLVVAEKYSVDFVMADYLRIEMDGNAYLKTLEIDDGYYDKDNIEKKIYPDLIMKECIDYGPLLSVWHCLYNIGFLRKNQLLFDEKVKWSEDNIFSACVGYCAQSFYYLKGEGLYHYYKNPGTITTSYRKGAWQVYCTMNDHLHDFFDSVTEYDFQRQMKLHMIYYACNCLRQKLSLKKKDAIVGIQNILDDKKTIDAFDDFKLPKTNIKLKIMLWLMKKRMSILLYLMFRGKM